MAANTSTFSSIGSPANIQSTSGTFEWPTGITPEKESQIGYSLQNEFQTWKTVGIVFIVLFAIFAIATLILMIIWISAKPPPSSVGINNPNLNSSQPILDPSAKIVADKKTEDDDTLYNEDENAEDVARVLMESLENEQDSTSNNDEDDNFNSAKLLNNSVLTKTQAKKMIHNQIKT